MIVRMEGQWICTSNPNDTNEYCVTSTQNWYVYTLLKGVFLFRAVNFCVGEFMLSGSRQWTPVVGSPCLLNQGQWIFHLGSPENDPIDFSTLGY